MKVKTITCHQVYNQGASLQEYALLRFLNDNGFQAEAIRYKPEYLSHHFSFFAVGNAKYNLPIIRQLFLLAKLPGRLIDLKRKKAFDEFEKKYIPTNPVRYRSNDELKKNLPLADAYICGSDQIWNSYFKNGKDAAFYLDFVPIDKLKMSYAASFATETIAEDLNKFVAEKVMRIEHISVRETSALAILEDLGITNGTQVLDPVFLLNKTHWMQFITPLKENYIFVYDFDCNPILKKMALEYKRRNNVKIFTVNKNIDYADKNFYLDGPEMFLSLMHHAKFIFTNSFHSVAFSIIFEKQFAAFNRTEHINTRVRDLLELFQMKNLISADTDIDGLEKFEYSSIQQILEQQIEKSKKFLLEIKKG